MDKKPIKTVHSDGTEEWTLNGLYHREDGPAYTESNGYQVWYLDGKLHREDGPAVITPEGHQEWWINGKRHREDGPAVIYSDGTQEWWLNDTEYSEAEWKQEVAKLNPHPLPYPEAKARLIEAEAAAVSAAWNHIADACGIESVPTAKQQEKVRLKHNSRDADVTLFCIPSQGVMAKLFLYGTFGTGEYLMQVSLEDAAERLKAHFNTPSAKTDVGSLALGVTKEIFDSISQQTGKYADIVVKAAEGSAAECIRPSFYRFKKGDRVADAAIACDGSATMVYHLYVSHNDGGCASKGGASNKQVHQGLEEIVKFLNGMD
jgi:hypothetical protein